MRGRGTRKAKAKPIFTMFDFVGVTDYHGDDDESAGGGVIVQYLCWIYKLLFL